MTITDNTSIREVQQSFSEKFPYLRLVFYAHPHEPGHGSPKAEELPLDKRVGEVRSIHSEGDVQASPEHRVRDFERQLSEVYGLHAQVFRKSGSLWMQTSATDEWTLGEQNRKGGASEQHYIDQHE